MPTPLPRLLAARLRRALTGPARQRLLRLAERLLARAGFPTNKSGNNMSMR
jgi:hypothetical protein